MRLGIGLQERDKCMGREEGREQWMESALDTGDEERVQES